MSRIRTLGGDDEARKQSKTEGGYHKRSLAETAMFRRKTLFSPSCSSHNLKNQKVESRLIAKAINLMTHTIMPQSQPCFA
jgi:hypothetical protein